MLSFNKGAMMKDNLNHLTDIQYRVTKLGATELPFNNDYFDNFEQGIYVDIITATPLFISTDKFESGCGWPAFSKPISDELLTTREDTSFGMQRVEVKAKASDSHLGHVFNDGPQALGGLRYCINSASLKFIPKDQLSANNLGYLIKLFDNEKQENS